MRKMSRADRKQQVLMLVRGAGGYLSISEVAHLCGVKVTPYLRGILADLLNEREGLACFEHQFPNGTSGLMYLDARLIAGAEGGHNG